MHNTLPLGSEPVGISLHCYSPQKRRLRFTSSFTFPSPPVTRPPTYLSTANVDRKPKATPRFSQQRSEQREWPRPNQPYYHE